MGVSPFGTMNRLQLKMHSATPLKLPRLSTLLGPMDTWITLIGMVGFLGQSLEDVCGCRGNARRTVRSDYPDSDPQVKSFPVVIMGTEYWHEILPFIEKMAKAGMIAPSDMQMVYVTDSVDDAIAHIRSHAIERFALLAVRRVRPHWRWLGERGLPPPLIALSNLRPPP